MCQHPRRSAVKAQQNLQAGCTVGCPARHYSSARAILKDFPNLVTGLSQKTSRRCAAFCSPKINVRSRLKLQEFQATWSPNYIAPGQKKGREAKNVWENNLFKHKHHISARQIPHGFFPNRLAQNHQAPITKVHATQGVTDHLAVSKKLHQRFHGTHPKGFHMSMSYTFPAKKTTEVI